MECTSLGQPISQAPGPETRNRNQEELETRENQGTRSAVSKKMWFVELFSARQEPGVRTDYQCICQSARGREGIPAQKRGGRGQEEVRRENKVLANHPVTGNFCYSKNSIQLMSLQRHVKAICVIRQTANTWFRALKLNPRTL